MDWRGGAAVGLQPDPHRTPAREGAGRDCRGGPHAGRIGQGAYLPKASRYERNIVSQPQFYMRCNRALVSPFHITSYFKSLEGQHRLHWRAVHLPARDIAPVIEDGRSATCVAESLGYDGRPDSPQDGRQRSPSIPDSATPSPAIKKATKWGVKLRAPTCSILASEVSWRSARRASKWSSSLRRTCRQDCGNWRRRRVHEPQRIHRR